MSTGTGASSQERGLVGDRGTSGTRAAAATGGTFCRDGGREDEGGRIIASETWGATLDGSEVVGRRKALEEHTELRKAGAAEEGGSQLRVLIIVHLATSTMRGSHDDRAATHLSMTTAGVWLAIAADVADSL